MTNIQLQHVAAGVNRCANALHWSDGDWPGAEPPLAFATHNAIAIYDVQETRILATLLGHTARVNCVRWFSGADFGTPVHEPPPTNAAAVALLASGAADGTVRLWLWQPANIEQPWQQAAVLEGHNAPVTSLTALGPTVSGTTLLVSTASAPGGEVLVWECSTEAAAGGPRGAAVPGSWNLRQRVPTSGQMQGCAELARLPADPDWLLLALGSMDTRVRLLVCPPGGQFQEACALQGHTDWVKSLAFAHTDDGRLLLASASQDKSIRIWAVALEGQQAGSDTGTDNSMSTCSGSLGKSALAASLLRYAPKPRIWTQAHCYAAIQEAMLVGHEDWVHTVSWQPLHNVQGAGASQPPCLLSASMDRTMMLWRPDAATGLWMAEESVGDAGINNLGYFTGAFNHAGTAIVAHGYTGALHLWRRRPAEAGGGWAPAAALGGHFGPVVDACWAGGGACLLTVSADQTARLSARSAGGRWCEVARPQVHGHDFSCVAALPEQPGMPGRHLYASGSEEKVVRVFEAPQAFADTLALVQGRAPPGGRAAGAAPWEVPALGATLPALGLSNRAVYADEETDCRDDVGAGVAEEGLDLSHGSELGPLPAAPAAVAGPPLEEHLAQNTLWPELHKLYGHGNDLFAMAADPQGRYLASACRAQTPDAAAIWLWDTQRWMGAGTLPAHSLTVTQLAFSPDGLALASSSRDRSVALFTRRQDEVQQGQRKGEAPFVLAGAIPKAHARIVWTLSWSPDGCLLATGSRDATVKLWSMRRPGGKDLAVPSGPTVVLTLPDSVRSVAFAPGCQPGAAYHLAVGLEDGSIQLLRLQCTSTSDCNDRGAEQLAVVSQGAVWQTSTFTQHAAAVRRLCWRRQVPGEHISSTDASCEASADACYYLASVGDDHAIRVFSVHMA